MGDKKVKFSEKNLPGIKCCICFSLKDRTKVQKDYGMPLRPHYLKRPTVALKKTLFFQKVKNLLEFLPFESKNVTA
jgi:hypothetical protein